MSPMPTEEHYRVALVPELEGSSLFSLWVIAAYTPLSEVTAGRLPARHEASGAAP